MYTILSLFQRAEFVPVTCGRGDQHVFELSKMNSSVRSIFDRAQLCNGTKSSFSLALSPNS
jgi:hypothetical protein